MLAGRAIARSGFDLMLRGLALFLGCFGLLSLLFSFSGSVGYDANIWWIDLRSLPGLMQKLLLLVFIVALLHRWLSPSPSSRRVARLRGVALGLLAFVLLVNSMGTWSLYAAHMLRTAEGPTGVGLGVPVPLTTVLAVCVLCMIRPGLPRVEASRTRRGGVFMGVAGSACVSAVCSALSLMLFFGSSDYRRPADAIVVYGCKAYADGRPSQALADRVHTACVLYHQGLAPVIVMSGGPVDASTHETEVMANYAVRQGVPREAIVLDRLGLDTQATADNVSGVLNVDARGRSMRVLAVSHDYHLPRVKLSLERAGMIAYTVPCEVRRGLPGKPYFVARETAAWWYYYLSPAMALITR